MSTTLLPPACYVILHIGTGPSNIAQSVSPLVVTSSGERFILRDDIWIERLDEELAKHIQKACEPADFNIQTAHYDRHLYAFVRQVPDSEKSKYEGMDDLFGTIALSRLIHPTSTGNRYCSHVFHFGLKDSAIHAVPYSGISPDTFLSDGNRDWLSVEDAANLRKLIPWLSTKMYDRIHHAYWYHEYAMRSYELDMRWPLVVTGFDALLNTKESQSGRQFKVRTKNLADHFKIPLTEDDLSKAWTLRSKLSHGQSFLYGLHTVLPQSAHKPLYDKLEELLRVTIRECLVDSTFADFFRDETAVETKWGKI